MSKGALIPILLVAFVLTGCILPRRVGRHLAVLVAYWTASGMRTRIVMITLQAGAQE